MLTLFNSRELRKMKKAGRKDERSRIWQSTA
jgi:hypothetical protein